MSSTPAHTPNVSAVAFMARQHRLLIDGGWCDARSGKRFDVFDPATGKVIAAVAEGTAADIDRAVRAARRSFETGVWRSMRADERAKIMWRFAELIESHAEELMHLDIANNGMTTAFAQAMVAGSAAWLRYFAGQTTQLFGKNASAAVSGGGQYFHAYTEVEPVGVAGLILPWNGPVGIFAVKVGLALAAGCSCVVKPAENTPLSALRLGELALEAGVPAGVLNIVTGFGDPAGQALAEHPDVDKISFTGSTAVGKKIVQLAAGNLKRVTLELGGKSPCIVFADADLGTAIPAAAFAIFANSGQVCSAGSRLFVERKIFDSVVTGIADIARSLQVGSGFDPATQIGPLISDKQRQRVMSYLELGSREGAELVVGGDSMARDGYFVQPTVFANVNASMRIVREEIFGPVLVATPFDAMEAVVHEANDTRYGLAGGIFTNDINKAHLIARRLRTGNICINCYGMVHPSMPFGGYKESGWGRELGEEGLEAFLEKKSVFVQLRE